MYETEAFGIPATVTQQWLCALHEQTQSRTPACTSRDILRVGDTFFVFTAPSVIAITLNEKTNLARRRPSSDESSLRNSLMRSSLT